jgi:hypothetical protein
VELAEILKSHSAEAATEKITGLEKSRPLFELMKELVEKVKGETQPSI